MHTFYSALCNDGDDDDGKKWSLCYPNLREMWKIATISCAVSSSHRCPVVHVPFKSTDTQRAQRKTSGCPGREVLIVDRNARGDKIHAFAPGKNGTRWLRFSEKNFVQIKFERATWALFVCALCARKKTGNLLSLGSNLQSSSVRIWKCVALMAPMVVVGWWCLRIDCEMLFAATSDRNEKEFMHASWLWAVLGRLLSLRVHYSYTMDGDAYASLIAHTHTHNKITENNTSSKHMAHATAERERASEREREQEKRTNERTSPKAAANTNYIHLRVEFQNSLNTAREEQTDRTLERKTVVLKWNILSFYPFCSVFSRERFIYFL